MVILVVLGLVLSLWWNILCEDFPAPEHLWNQESKRFSYQVSKVKCEQSRCLVETALPAAMDPCAPSEPVPFSSGFVVTSEHAVISCLSGGSFAPVQGIFRVDCAVTHGFGGVESVPRATYISTPSKPVVFSSGIEVTSEHAAISVFSAEYQLGCKAHLASTVQSLMDSMEPCLVGPVEKTRVLHTSQSLTQYAQVGYLGVELPFQSAQESSTGCETQIHCTT